MTGRSSRSTGLRREFEDLSCPSIDVLIGPTRTSAWFGDLKDGVHKGDSNDPRVSVIEVVPDEIRYWLPNKGRVGQALDIGVHALMGKVSSAGELRTISKQEVCPSVRVPGLWPTLSFCRYNSLRV